MPIDKIILKNIKKIESLSVEFEFLESNFLVVTGKNGAGKTSLVKAVHLLSDPQIFGKSTSLNAIQSNSEVILNIEGCSTISFKFNKKLGVLDTRDSLPKPNSKRSRHKQRVSRQPAVKWKLKRNGFTRESLFANFPHHGQTTDSKLFSRSG